jgi:hypothetical protein
VCNEQSDQNIVQALKQELESYKLKLNEKVKLPTLRFILAFNFSLDFQNISQIFESSPCSSHDAFSFSNITFAHFPKEIYISRQQVAEGVV